MCEKIADGVCLCCSIEQYDPQTEEDADPSSGMVMTVCVCRHLLSFVIVAYPGVPNLLLELSLPNSYTDLGSNLGLLWAIPTLV